MPSDVRALNENVKFVRGWGLGIVVFALSLIIQYLWNNLGITIGFFLIALALCLVILGMSSPKTPQISMFGLVIMLIGIALTGIMVLHANPLIVIGLIILVAGICIIFFTRGESNV